MTPHHTKSRGRLFLLAGGHRSRDGSNPLPAMMIASLEVPSPRIAYVGAASGDDRDFFSSIRNMLVESGAGAVEMVPLAGRRRVGTRAAETLARANAIFISGGDVEEGMQALQACGAIQVLTDHFRSGTPFMGISAGSIMLARAWVRWRDPDDGASAEIFPCLGLAPILCDTHDERSGWTELRTLLALSPEGSIGYGIPSGGGIIVDPDGAITPCGGPVAILRNDGNTISIDDKRT
ncbi:MAG TPA: Type 1 glutamine amidotransferase-like domain-containing protein [Planctomycetota bacterium]|nr:Type 1 glutamine amidotransferase-like domain-containing protein [Planctomycetota bacterium]